jgi:pyrroline-5-carboxylate reductase
MTRRSTVKTVEIPAMKLGFLGSGTIAAAIVEGLCVTASDVSITVSPRNAVIAANLAEQFKKVRVAATNQEVLDASDIVFLAVRPQIADAVLGELHFRANHHVVSLIAAVSLAYLQKATAPAGTVTRAVPIPTVARRQGPTAIFPPNPTVKALFDSLGTAVELEDESEFNAFTAATAMMASYFRFVGTVSSWMVSNGIAPENAQAYVGQMMFGLAGTWTASPDRSFALLTDEYQTRGGLNEQVLNYMTGKGMFTNIEQALDEIKARLVKAST